jgi:protein qmcA
MEKEMKAEREKRANILEAQAKRESAILVAEGEKQAAILRAEAKKEQAIKEAEGEAEAILSIQRAKAEALRLLNEAKPTPEVLSLKGMEAFEKAADGNATKIIVPANFQNLASTITAFAELNEKTEN